MFETYGLLILGFVFLLKGADILIDGTSSLATRLRIPQLIIGLTIVAFGTSLPELIVNVFASSSGSEDLAIGNILGSNIANILLILGVAAIFHPLTVQRVTVWREILFSFLAVIILGILVADPWLNGAETASLSRSDGIILISYFLLFLYYTFGRTRTTPTRAEQKLAKLEERKGLSIANDFVFIAIGIIGLAIGGRWIVQSATAIAFDLGLSEAFIGLTVVAIGTSLPELATSAVAAYKKNVSLAVGNAVGSNLFNILWVLGLSASMSPLDFSEHLQFDLVIAGLVSLLLFLNLLVDKDKSVTKNEGIVFVALYFVYIGYLTVIR